MSIGGHEMAAGALNHSQDSSPKTFGLFRQRENGAWHSSVRCRLSVHAKIDMLVDEGVSPDYGVHTSNP
jgi:hypothetical protein